MFTGAHFSFEEGVITLHIYGVAHVDQAMEILTGVPVGVAEATGKDPVESINQRGLTRVAQLSALRQSFSRRPEERKSRLKK